MRISEILSEASNPAQQAAIAIAMKKAEEAKVKKIRDTNGPNTIISVVSMMRKALVYTVENIDTRLNRVTTEPSELKNSKG